MLPNFAYKASIGLNNKPEKSFQERKNKKNKKRKEKYNNFYEHGCKTFINQMN